MTQSGYTVVHRPDEACFEVIVDGQRSSVDYRLRDDVMSIVHTGVPPALEGRGIAAALVEAALAHARAQGWKVQPMCSYVRVYMRRHPQTQDLLA